MSLFNIFLTLPDIISIKRKGYMRFNNHVSFFKKLFNDSLKKITLNLRYFSYNIVFLNHERTINIRDFVSNSDSMIFRYQESVTDYFSEDRNH